MNYKHFFSIAAVALVAFFMFGTPKVSAQEYYNPTTYGQYNPYSQNMSGYGPYDQYQYAPVNSYSYQTSQNYVSAWPVTTTYSSPTYSTQYDSCGMWCVPQTMWGSYGYNPTTYGQYNPYAPNETAWQQQNPQVGNQPPYTTQYMNSYGTTLYSYPVYMQQTDPVQTYSTSMLRGYTTY